MNARIPAWLASLTLALLNTLWTLHAQPLPNNFWPNAQFEAGENLDDPAGTLNNWNRGGANPAICQISTKASSPTHGLAVVDADNSYGEWYCDTSLAGRASAGDKLDLRWQEVYEISGGEMRLTVLFLDSGGGLTGVNHFVVQNTSEGFNTGIQDSPFVQRDESVEVPEGAATLRISLVSGGSVDTTGTYVIDDLFVARHPAPVLLPGNIWTNNPTFEVGDNLDQPQGSLTQWNRGGAKPAICQVFKDNSISPTHALGVVDTDTGYGEWYSDLPLAGVVRAGDELNLQWFELFRVANGEMRVTVLFLNATGGAADVRHFVARGQSAGWAGSAAASPFVKRNEKVTVPDGAAALRVSLVSGGAAETTGIMVIDDFSANKSVPPLPDVLAGNLWPNPGFEEGDNLDDAAGATVANWSRGGNDPVICTLVKENSVSQTHALAVQDTNAAGYGEWYANFRLGAATAGGRLLNLQWFEMFQITEGEMRLSLVFFDATNQVLGQNHFVARAKSDGWKTNLTDSAFTRRNEQVAVPLGAQRLMVSLVSGGPLSSIGVMAIDNFSLAPAPSAPVALFGNFWSNVGFEDGTNLDQSTIGKPAGWERGGGDVTMDQVLTSAYMSSTHALAVVDTNSSGYGEWYQSFDLAGKAKPGESLSAQWWELYSITNGEMRLSFVFFNSSNAQVGVQHFVARNQSAGWIDDIPHSFFTNRLEQFVVPNGATRLLVTLASGGPLETTGVMLIDDLSLAKPLPPPDLLAGNFWPNPTFETGTQMETPTAGVPAGWNRGGTLIRGDQVRNDMATSPTHALAVVDDKQDAYSEWYANLLLEGKAVGGDVLEAQWFWIYDTTGDMRLSLYFFGADNATLGQKHFVVNGQSDGWTGDLASSPFVKRRERATVPDGAVRLMVTMASGGSVAVTGTLIMDDLSLRIASDEFRITAITKVTDGWRLTWESAPDNTYTIEASDSLAPPSFAPLPGGENLAGEPGADTTSFTDTTGTNGTGRYYRLKKL